MKLKDRIKNLLSSASRSQELKPPTKHDDVLTFYHTKEAQDLRWHSEPCQGSNDADAPCKNLSTTIAIAKLSPTLREVTGLQELKMFFCDDCAQRIFNGTNNFSTQFVIDFNEFDELTSSDATDFTETRERAKVQKTASRSILEK